MPLVCLYVLVKQYRLTRGHSVYRLKSLLALAAIAISVWTLYTQWRAGLCGRGAGLEQ